VLEKIKACLVELEMQCQCQCGFFVRSRRLLFHRIVLFILFVLKNHIFTPRFLQSRNDENASLFCSDDISSSNGNSHFGSNNSSHFMGNSGTGNSSRGRENRENQAFNSNSRNNDSENSGYQGARETGIIEKLLHSYGFIQCCERQARLFFHFSQFDGTIEHLKLGDPVEFEMTYDRRTGKPIASAVTKIGPEVVSYVILSYLILYRSSKAINLRSLNKYLAKDFYFYRS